jgi:hypothetical protein
VTGFVVEKQWNVVRGVTLVGGTRCANPVQTMEVSPVAVYRQYWVPSWCVNRSSTRCDSLAARIAAQVTAHQCSGSLPASTIDERFGRMSYSVVMQRLLEA